LSLLAAKFRVDLDKLPAATEVYDFSRQRAMLTEQIERLEAGADVSVPAWELADELLRVAGIKGRFDSSGPRCWRISGMLWWR